MDNSPLCQINNFDHYCRRNFQKNLQISVGLFLWSCITYLNEKKNQGSLSLVDLAWNALYICRERERERNSHREPRAAGSHRSRTRRFSDSTATVYRKSFRNDSHACASCWIAGWLVGAGDASERRKAKGVHEGVPGKEGVERKRSFYTVHHALVFLRVPSIAQATG